jgi:hypothetical protein
MSDIIELGIKNAPDPFPGSEKAVRMGCLCPRDQPWPHAIAFDVECPVHPLQHAFQQ